MAVSLGLYNMFKREEKEENQRINKGISEKNNTGLRVSILVFAESNFLASVHEVNGRAIYTKSLCCKMSTACLLLKRKGGNTSVEANLSRSVQSIN